MRAILEGRKTQTRRICSPQPFLPPGKYRYDGEMEDGHALELLDDGKPTEKYIQCPKPPYLPGDRIWVRETFRPVCDDDGMLLCFDYRADPDWKWKRMRDEFRMSRWRPNIHMPRAASRITLEATDVRVEQVQDISEEGVLAEGLWKCDCGCGTWSGHGGMYQRTDPIAAYQTLWDGIYGPGSWESNPWVWVICFKVLEVKK